MYPRLEVMNSVRSHWWESESHLLLIQQTTGLSVKSHDVMTAESEAAERLRWILISAYSGSVFKGGVPQGNLDGKAGLLILKKLLICSLLALRTLITSIVVLVPLRPEWMSLLRNSFLLPCRWRRSHQKRPEWDVRLPADFIQHEALSSFTALLTFSVCFAVLFAWCFM